MNVIFLFYLLAFSLPQEKSIGVGDKYIVDSQTLNVRKYGNINSEIIGQVKYGDTIISTGNFNNWIRFSVKNDTRIKEKPINNYAYLHIDYLKLLEKKEQPKPITKESSPFAYGYYEGAKYPFIIIFLILALKDYVKHKRIRDGRFTKGYKEIPFSVFELLKYAFYAFIFSLPFGLVCGFYFWFLK
jgi:hypothetical protein